jgi:hypothetical protein
MITAIQSKILVRFAIEMKNFIPRWLHFIPRFPQIKRTLEMCHSRSAAGHCYWFSESAQMFSKGLEIFAHPLRSAALTLGCFVVGFG